MKTKTQKHEDAAIHYVKGIEDLGKEIENCVKDLDKSSEKLLFYDLEALSESQKTLRQLKQQLDKLGEKLTNKDKIIAEDPHIRTMRDYIKAMSDVGNAVDKAEKIMEDANKAIDRFGNAIGEFKEGLSNPYIREMVQEKFENELKIAESRIVNNYWLEKPKKDDAFFEAVRKIINENNNEKFGE